MGSTDMNMMPLHVLTLRGTGIYSNINETHTFSYSLSSLRQALSRLLINKSARLNSKLQPEGPTGIKLRLAYSRYRAIGPAPKPLNPKPQTT